MLDGEIPWGQHRHRADDIATAMRLADEFGYRLVINHGTEGHLMADVLAEPRHPGDHRPAVHVAVQGRGAQPRRCATRACWPRPGSRSRSPPTTPWCRSTSSSTRRSLAVKEGLDPATALRSITINPAGILGLDDRVGSLAAGKDGDVVLWAGDPLDVMSRAQRVFIEGREVYHYDASGQTGFTEDPYRSVREDTSR